jgi:nicotinamidase-related amidase
MWFSIFLPDREKYRIQEEFKMRIFAEDTAALIIDFQEKLVPAIANNEEVVAKAALFCAGLKELGVPMAVTQQYTKGLGDTVPAIKEAIGEFEAMEKMSFSAMGCEEFVAWVKAQGKKTILVCGVEAHICVLQSIIDLLGEGFRVFIVADCVGSRLVYNRDYAIQRATQEGAFVTTCEGALYEMVQGAGTPHFKAISKLTK